MLPACVNADFRDFSISSIKVHGRTWRRHATEGISFSSGPEAIAHRTGLALTPACFPPI
jgi:hypothetical protein